MNRLSWLLLLCPVLAACSNLTTRTYDPSHVTPRAPPPGIPFTLNKPQFTITHTPATTTAPESYSAVPSYIPDPDAHFAVTMTPAWTASIDWAVTYDGSGSFAGTNAKATDQSVATLGSLAKLALAVGAIADRSAKSDKETLAEIEKRVTADLSHLPALICCDADHQLRPITAADPTDLRAQWAKMHADMDKLAAAGQLSTYTFVSDEDRTLLRTALHTSRPDFAPVQQTIDDSITADQKLTTDVAGKVTTVEPIDPNTFAQIANQIHFAFNDFDLKKLTAIQSNAVTLRNQQRQKLLATDAGKAKFAADPTMRLQYMVAYWSSTAIDALKKGPNETLFALAEPDNAKWEAKVVADLNDRINAQAQADRANAISAKAGGDIEADDPVLIDLKRRKAAVLGLATVYDQTLKLQKVPPTDPRAFKSAQDELVVLQKQLADAEAALATPTPTAAAEPTYLADAVQADAPIPALGCTAWVADKAHGLPDYVVVVAPLVPEVCPTLPAKPAPGPGPAPGPAGAPATGDASTAPKKPPQAAPVPTVKTQPQ